MEVTIGELKVIYPFKYVYPDQYQYMKFIKEKLEGGNSNSVVQVPPSISLASCLFSVYISLHIQGTVRLPKIVYSTSNLREINHSAEILKLVLKTVEKKTGIDVNILAISIAEKKALCTHDDVSKQTTIEGLESACLERIAPWNRNKHSSEQTHQQSMDHSSSAQQQQNSLMQNETTECRFYENYFSGYKDQGFKLETGAYSIEDLKQIGNERSICPFYFMEEHFANANIIICNYFYLFSDSRKTTFDRKHLDNALLFVQEAGKLDEQICELFTERVSKVIIDHSLICLDQLNDKIKAISAKKAKQQYDRLLHGLNRIGTDINFLNKEIVEKRSGSGPTHNHQNENSNSHVQAHNNNSNNHNEESKQNDNQQQSDIIKFPGQIRKPEHFLIHVKKFLIFLKKALENYKSKTMSHSSFMDKYCEDCYMDENYLPLTYFPLRLREIYIQIRIFESEELQPLITLLRSAYIFAKFSEGYEVVFDMPKQNPFYKDDPQFMNTLSFACMNPKNPFEILTSNFKSIILNSESISDLKMYSNIMGLAENPNIESSDQLTLHIIELDDRASLNIQGVTVVKGADQIELSTETARVNDEGIMRNYANMIENIADAVPDGIQCLFPNYQYLNDIGLRYLGDILQRKLIFSESYDYYETYKSVHAFKMACQSGRGGILYQIMRGKVAGHANFDQHEAKCVIVFGIPLEYAHPREFLARVSYFKTAKMISEKDYISYSCMQEINYSLAQLIKSREQPLMIILADRRFAQKNKLEKLPVWLQQKLFTDSIPSDQVVLKARKFLKTSEGQQDIHKIDLGGDIKNLVNKFETLSCIETQKEQ